MITLWASQWKAPWAHLPREQILFFSQSQQWDGGGPVEPGKKVRRNPRSLLADPPGGGRCACWFQVGVFIIISASWLLEFFPTGLNKVDRLLWGTLLSRDPYVVPLGHSSLDSVRWGHCFNPMSVWLIHPTAESRKVEEFVDTVLWWGSNQQGGGTLSTREATARCQPGIAQAVQTNSQQTVEVSALIHGIVKAPTRTASVPVHGQ